MIYYNLPILGYLHFVDLTNLIINNNIKMFKLIHLGWYNTLWLLSINILIDLLSTNFGYYKYVGTTLNKFIILWIINLIV